MSPGSYYKSITLDYLGRLKDSFKGYDLKGLRGDFQAGLSVGIVAVPQAMAYAIIAEVPPVYGLYTLVFQSLIAAAFNSHPLLSIGPVNSQSLVVASIATRLQAPSDIQAYLTLVMTLTLVKGLIQLAMATLQLGQLTRYVSRSVIVGFTAGAGLLIAVKQIGPFLGFATPRLPGDWPGVIGMAQQVLRGFTMNHYSLLFGASALAIVVGSRMISKLIPGPVIAVAGTGLAVFIMKLTGTDLNLLGELPVWPEDWPMPQFDPGTMERLIPAGLALALLGSLETHAIAKSLAAKTGHRVSSNQDLFSQGLSNTVSAFLASIPGSTSLSRSALNESAGGRTLLANIFNAGFVMLTLVLFAKVARYVPMSAIAGILIMVAWGLVDFNYIRKVTKTSRSDGAVLMATFIATLTVPLEYAVLVGVALNIALYLRLSSQLQLEEMVPTSAGPFMEQPLTDKSGERAVTMLQIQGELFFALADELEEKLHQLECGHVRVVIFRLKRVHSIDTTVLSVLERFARKMAEQDRHVILCGVRHNLMQQITDFGMVKLLSKENVFPTDFGVFASAEAALARAKDLLGKSIDIGGLPEEDRCID